MGYRNIKKQKKLIFLFKLRILIFQCPGTTHITNFTRMPHALGTSRHHVPSFQTLTSQRYIANATMLWRFLFSAPAVLLTFRLDEHGKNGFAECESCLLWSYLLRKSRNEYASSLGAWVWPPPGFGPWWRRTSVRGITNFIGFIKNLSSYIHNWN